MNPFIDSGFRADGMALCWCTHWNRVPEGRHVPLACDGNKHTDNVACRTHFYGDEDVNWFVDWSAWWKEYARPRFEKRIQPVATGMSIRHTCSVCGDSKSNYWSQAHGREYDVWAITHNQNCARAVVEALMRLEWVRQTFTERERQIERELLDRCLPYDVTFASVRKTYVDDEDALRVLSDFYEERGVLLPAPALPRIEGLLRSRHVRDQEKRLVQRLTKAKSVELNRDVQRRVQERVDELLKEHLERERQRRRDEHAVRQWPKQGYVYPRRNK